MTDLVRLALEPFQHDFMLRALAAVILLAVVCGVVGCFVVLRNLTFIGEGLAHGSLAGLAIGYAVKGNVLAFAGLFALGLALAIGYLHDRGRVAMDVAIGVIFSTAAAAGILLISHLRLYSDLTSYLFGSILAIGADELWPIGLGGLSILIIMGLFYKELVALAFDRELAAVIGLPTRALHYGSLLIVGGTVVLAIQTAGLILVTALLVIPAAAAFQVTRRLERAIGLAALFGVVAGIVGLYASYYLRTASGASIVMAASIIFGLCLALSRRRVDVTA